MKFNRQLMQEYINNFQEKSPIGRFMQMELSFDEESGSAIVKMPYNPELDHALGGIHGGVYATLMDTAGWFTAAVAQETDRWVATSELSFHLLESVKQTSLRAVGRLLKAGKRQTVVEVFLYDQKDKLVGHATGTFLVLPKLESFL